MKKGKKRGKEISRAGFCYILPVPFRKDKERSCENCLWTENKFCKKKKVDLSMYPDFDFSEPCDYYISVEEVERRYKEKGESVI